jgi:hypothetical protein
MLHDLMERMMMEKGNVVMDGNSVRIVVRRI